MSETIQLTEQWGLRKLQLGDRCEWALQYLGMDWIRMCEFLPSKNDTSMDDDIRKFAEATRAERIELRAEMYGEVASRDATIERLTEALEMIAGLSDARCDEAPTIARNTLNDGALMGPIAAS